MSTVTESAPKISSTSPIHGTWDWLSLPATTTQIAGTVVTANKLDADLHIETTTIMFADVVESVRLIEQDERANVSRIRALLTQISASVPSYGGVVLERRGDGLLIRFDNPKAAALCAASIHSVARSRRENSSARDAIHMRIGIHQGDVLTDQVALYGRAMNAAARVASLANPDETVASADVRDQLVDGIDVDIEDIGECFLKHVDIPIRAFRLSAVGTAPLDSRELIPKLGDATLRPTLIVLPLESESERPAPLSPTFVDVFADQLARWLSQSSSINVISSQTASLFRNRAMTPSAIMESVRADYACRGHCRLHGDQFEATIELVRREQSQVVWRASIAGKQSDVVATDSELIGRVAGAVSENVVELSLRAALTRPLPNLPVHALYLAAISTMHRFSKRDFARALPMLEVLQERAPRHPDVLSWIARWHVLRVVQGWSDHAKHDSDRALSYADQALMRDDKCALAWTVRGSAEIGVRGDVDAARSMYSKALESNPNESLAWLLASVANGIVGDSPGASEASLRAARLAPLHPYGFYYDSLRSTAALFADDFQLAEQLARRSIRRNMLHGSAYRALAISLGLQGRCTEAHDTVAQLLQIEPTCSLDDVRRRYGDRADANARFVDVLRVAGLPEHVQVTTISLTGETA